MATSLLSLSRELRDLIYVEVLNSELPPPQTEQDIRNGQAELDFCTEEETCVPLSCNLSIRINAVPLLLVNRQIHAEFSDTISLAKKDKRVRYKLDCVVRQESEIYLTWLSVPIPCSHVASLQVDIRHYGDAEKGYSAWWVSGWLGAQITDSLYGLLRRFCRCGPGFYNTQPGGIKVGVLLLNIITPSLHVGFLLPAEASSQIGEVTDTL